MITLKNKTLVFSLMLSLSFLFTQCSSGDDTIVNPPGGGQSGGGGNPSGGGNPGNGGGVIDNWLIPIDEVFDGGPGKDGIPSIDFPMYTPVSEVSYLTDDELVIGIYHNGEVKGYPHFILDWHEITNSSFATLDYSMTYCPLTGTAFAWNRNIDNTVTEFGVSGLLYNSNLMPYDRATNSTWSQQRLDAVNGELISTKVNTIPVLETNWASFRLLFPDAEILNTDTGINRPYGTYPYGTYKTDDRLLFPVSRDDNRLFKKERVLGVSVDDQAKVYRFSSFATGSNDNIVVYNETVNSKDVVVVGSDSQQFMTAFERLSGDTTLEFTAVQNNGTVVMEDNEGNQWDLWGNAVEGPRQGQKLNSITNYMGYWFCFAPFHTTIDIFE